MVPPDDIYPVDPWAIFETRFSPRFIAQTETIFALSNGYLGLRGNLEEGAPVYDGGTFVNGFYETWPIVYGEEAYGFAKTGQTIVDVTDGKTIKLYVDDEPFEIENADILEFNRTLDMRLGLLTRRIQWVTPAGKRVTVESKRMVSFVHRHLAMVTYEVKVENRDAHLILASELATRRRHAGENNDPRRARHFDGNCLEPLCAMGDDLHHDHRAVLCHRTRQSGLLLACGMDHVLETEGRTVIRRQVSDNVGEMVFSVDVDPGQPVRITKFLAYHHSPARDGDDTRELCARVQRTLSRNMDIGHDRLITEHAEYIRGFWDRSDVIIEGDPRIQQAVRFNLYQLLQATARVEGHGVPAKGLTGRGYEGHYFWDTEIYVLPFLTYTTPRFAHNLMRHRFSMLDLARARARELGHEGALFPWRTINGEEASAYYAAGTAQYHINADIAYAIRQLFRATYDLQLLRDGAADVLVETARLWVDLGCYPFGDDGPFCINGVTGPDEYTAVVDNNRYTNMMARENLRSSIRGIEYLRDKKPGELAQLVQRTNLDLAELDAWQLAADRMHLPIDETTGIHPQDDSFLEKEVWDFANTPPDKFPLLLHYHPLVIYRHQVIKQADVVMAMFLCGDDFTLEEKRRNFDYYDPLTTRDSSLSSSIQSIIATELGYEDRAFEYFLDAVAVDLADIGGNVVDGVHVASMGGAWMALVHGFAGMRDHDGELSFDPKLPSRWQRLRFQLTFQGCRFEVDITPDSVVYALHEGDDLALRHRKEEIHLTAAAPRVSRPHV
jgi:alpha,alpha-trehalose phosphorylase